MFITFILFLVTLVVILAILFLHERNREQKIQIKSFSYRICSDDDIMFYLSLLDMLDFRQNIIIEFYCAKNQEIILKEFQVKIQYSFTKDLTFNNGYDKFRMFIPELQSNKQLYELINKIDFMEEGWSYITSDTKFTALFNSWQGDVYFEFGKEYFESANIENILNEWEKTFAGIKFYKWTDN